MKRILILLIEDIIEGLMLFLPLILLLGLGIVVRAEDVDYVPMIEEAAEDYDLSPELIQAMCERESTLNPKATAGNCQGLMQINCKIWSGRIQTLYEQGKIEDTNLYNPKTNLVVGCSIIAELFDEYQDPYAVLMYYNMGWKGLERFEDGRYSKYAEWICERAYEITNEKEQ